LIQERVATFGEAPEYADFFFLEKLDYDPALLSKDMSEEVALEALEATWEGLRDVEGFDAASLEKALRPLAKELKLKTGQLFGLLRVAVTGRTAAPPLFQTMEVLGKERCLERIEAALERLQIRA
jgi:glutamyl-tRNA synthetase